MSGPTTLAEHIADHVCGAPGCDRFGPFGTGFRWTRGEPNAHGLRPLVLLPGAMWWCRAHRPPPAELTVDLPPLHVPPAPPKQKRLL
jgi:hypothetical protein